MDYLNLSFQSKAASSLNKDGSNENKNDPEMDYLNSSNDNTPVLLDAIELDDDDKQLDMFTDDSFVENTQEIKKIITNKHTETKINHC